MAYVSGMHRVKTILTTTKLISMDIGVCQKKNTLIKT
jgi:hypothetical protein